MLALLLTLLAPPAVVGAPAPRFTLKVHNAEAAGMKRLASRALVAEGRPLVLDFAASWCGPCKAALPALAALAKAPPTPKLVVAVVVTDETPAGQAAMLAELEAMGFPGVVVVDPFRLLARRFGVEALPHSVLIDGAGVVRWIGIGEAAGGLVSAARALAPQ